MYIIFSVLSIEIQKLPGLLMFDLLWRQPYNLVGARRFAHLMVGLTESDSLLAIARRYLHVPYKKQLYTVSWPEETAWHCRPETGCPIWNWRRCKNSKITEFTESL